MRVLASAIIVYTLIFSGISLWKYENLRYNARDVAIYNQIVWQLTNQKSSNKSIINKLINDVRSSIQGHSYLGDHFEPILLLLVPFYTLFSDPRTLLILQTIALALAAWPLSLIVQEIMKTKKQASNRTGVLPYAPTARANAVRPYINWMPTFIGALWLLHPAVQNANLFEFHSLSFAPLFIFFLFWAWFKIRARQCLAPTPYERSMLRPYIFFTLFLFLSLSVREDVALITFILGLFILWKGFKQRAVIPISALTIALSATWFLVAQRIISHFSPSHEYQYRVYYEWLSRFDSLGSTIKGVFTHLVTIQNLEMLIGLLLPLLFLPLLKPRWLLLSLPPLAAIVLSQAGGGALVWQTHYGLLLLPGVFLALIFGISTLLCHSRPVSRYGAGSSGNPETKKKSLAAWFLFWIPTTSVGDDNGKKIKDPSIALLALLTAAIGSMLIFSPLIPAMQAITADNNDNSQQWALIASVPPNVSVAATDRFLAPLSSRSNLTLLPLMLLGVQQYGAAPYTPVEPDYILLDEEDVWADVVQAYTLAWTRPYAQNMLPQFRKMLDEGDYRILAREDSVVLLARGAGETKIPPFTFEERAIMGVMGGLELDRLGSVRLVTD